MQMPIRTVGCQMSGCLAALLMLRNMVGVESIADLQRMENRVAVKKAVKLLPANSFTLKQLEAAAAYLTGKDLNLASKDQAVIILLRELE